MRFLKETRKTSGRTGSFLCPSWCRLASGCPLGLLTFPDVARKNLGRRDHSRRWCIGLICSRKASEQWRDLLLGGCKWDWRGRNQLHLRVLVLLAQKGSHEVDCRGWRSEAKMELNDMRNVQTWRVIVLASPSALFTKCHFRRRRSP